MGSIFAAEDKFDRSFEHDFESGMLSTKSAVPESL
jgi:hypothetical protein